MFEFTDKIKIFALLPKNLALKWKIPSHAAGKDWKRPTYNSPDHLLPLLLLGGLKGVSLVPVLTEPHRNGDLVLTK